MNGKQRTYIPITNMITGSPAPQDPNFAIANIFIGNESNAAIDSVNMPYVDILHNNIL